MSRSVSRQNEEREIFKTALEGFIYNYVHNLT